MQSVIIAKAFCERAGLPEGIAEKLPAWFFINNGGKDKQHATRVAEIYDEATALKNQYLISLQRKLRIAIQPYINM